MIALVKSSDIDRWRHSAADVIVVCDVDGASAAAAAETVTDRRTAVFVGDITSEPGRSNAIEFASETFNVDAVEVVLAIPS